jgi:hypothetical protein
MACVADMAWAGDEAMGGSNTGSSDAGSGDAGSVGRAGLSG